MGDAELANWQVSRPTIFSRGPEDAGRSVVDTFRSIDKWWSPENRFRRPQDAAGKSVDAGREQSEVSFAETTPEEINPKLVLQSTQ